MKKGKILALALAAGITFMGAGYAAWTDTVQINTTVSTGFLDVDFGDCEVISSSKGMKIFDIALTNDGNDQRDGENGNRDRDKATLKITDAYPGAKGEVQLKLIEEDGSIDAEMRSIEISDIDKSKWVNSKIILKIYEGDKVEHTETIYCERAQITDNKLTVDLTKAIRVNNSKINISIEFGNIAENLAASDGLGFNITASFGQYHGVMPTNDNDGEKQ